MRPQVSGFRAYLRLAGNVGMELWVYSWALCMVVFQSGRNPNMHKRDPHRPSWCSSLSPFHPEFPRDPPPTAPSLLDLRAKGLVFKFGFVVPQPQTAKKGI